MSLKVVGAGFGRTGTLSLKHALERLGFEKCYHMAEVAVHPEHAELWRAAWRGENVWEKLFDGYQAAVDWPVSAFWRPLMDVYPDAKILLSVRDPQRWYRSAADTIFNSMKTNLGADDTALRTRIQMAKEIIVDGTFEGDLDDEARCIEIYNANMERCRAEVPADRLIVFEASQGWEPLCAALGCEVPDEAYPRVNTKEEFHERWRKRANPGS